MTATLRHCILELNFIASLYKHVTQVVLIFTSFFYNIYYLTILGLRDVTDGTHSSSNYLWIAV